MAFGGCRGLKINRVEGFGFRVWGSWVALGESHGRKIFLPGVGSKLILEGGHKGEGTMRIMRVFDENQGFYGSCQCHPPVPAYPSCEVAVARSCSAHSCPRGWEANPKPYCTKSGLSYLLKTLLVLLNRKKETGTNKQQASKQANNTGIRP